MNSLDKVRFVVPEGANIDALLAQRPLAPFDPAVIEFIERLGKALMASPQARRHPELVALGFWARGANIKRMKDRFDAQYPDALRLARGLAFHIAPSNVDTIFVYSLLLSMLAGNVNLVRMSSRAAQQSDLLNDILKQVVEASSERLRGIIGIVRYEHDQSITDAFSRHCDVRVVWGGDGTVELIRKSPLSPGGTELTFPNKYSLAVVDAKAWLASDVKTPVARDFVNDSLWFGQMACSSPRALVWRGSADDIAAASTDFWHHVEAGAREANLGWEDAGAVAKLLAEQDNAVSVHASVVPLETNFISVVRCPIALLGEPNGTGGGFFREFHVAALEELGASARRNWQTVASFGVPKADWQAFLLNAQPQGIDRIVPFGHALNFNAIWDGIDFLTSLTRIVVIDAPQD